MTTRPVVLLTDFGYGDDFVGVCHGVILSRAPDARVVHLTHGITPQFVLQGALVLRNTLPYMPVGVHMAVVDPGVGTTRRAVAVEAADDRFFVGPDNGLLGPALQRAGGAVAAVSIENPSVILTPTSHTFHGRDVFSPAAALLVTGGRLEELGPSVDPQTLQTLEIPAPRRTAAGLEGEVWNVDRFGNVALHLDESTLVEVLGDCRHVEVAVRNDCFYADVVRTFGEVRSGAILLYIDPYGGVSLAVNSGSAADMFRLKAGDSVLISPQPVSGGRTPDRVVRARAQHSR